LIGGVILALLIAALCLFLKHRRARRLGGLPSGDLIASDHDQKCPLLVSSTYGLKGKPDSLVRTTNGTIIPVERKKARAPQRVRNGDLIQGIAYCILVEDNYGQPPPYVRIQYADRWFDVPYTSDLKLWTLQIAQRLRLARRARVCNRSHQHAAKCRNCGQRPNCNQAL
jgi:CRISPR-associated exonuclease Cas4